MQNKTLYVASEGAGKLIPVKMATTPVNMATNLIMIK